jgi:hypothetical protein
MTLITATLILLPLGYVMSQALSADPAVWSLKRESLSPFDPRFYRWAM